MVPDIVRLFRDVGIEVPVHREGVAYAAGIHGLPLLGDIDLVPAFYPGDGAVPVLSRMEVDDGIVPVRLAVGCGQA